MFKLVTWRLKSCPRCTGDLVLELDHWGLYEQCIQCGYLRDLDSVVEAKKQPVQEESKKLVQAL